MSELPDEPPRPIAVTRERAPAAHRIDRDRTQELTELASAPAVESAAGPSGKPSDFAKTSGCDRVGPFMKQEGRYSLDPEPGGSIAQFVDALLYAVADKDESADRFAVGFLQRVVQYAPDLVKPPAQRTADMARTTSSALWYQRDARHSLYPR